MFRLQKTVCGYASVSAPQISDPGPAAELATETQRRGHGRL